MGNSQLTARLLGTLPGPAAGLEPGRDVLLPDAPEAAAAPAGTLLHDWLDDAERTSAQEDASRAMAAWRSRSDDALSPGGICLPAVYAGHLLTDAFLAMSRIAAALPAFIEAQRPSRVELHGVDPDLAGALRATLAGLGVEAYAPVLGPPPRYPIGLATSLQRSRLTPLREAIGVPGRTRGEALIQPFRNLSGLWTALPARGIQPVLDPALPPSLPKRELLLRIRFGGFLGHPGALERRRSRREVGESLAAAAAQAGQHGDPLAALAERRALGLLGQLAGDTLALAAVFRAAAGRGLRVAVVPSDAAPYARTFSAATRELGGSLVQVQHGFFSDLWRVDGALSPHVDGLEAERVAAWAPRDAARLQSVALGEVSVTGNPGAVNLAAERIGRVDPATGRRDGGAAVVLLQSPSPSTLSFDVRASRRYVTEALAGLAAADFKGPVILRPHSLDPTDYRSLAARMAHVSVSSHGTLATALAGAAVCIGTLSTATLEAIAWGVPTVFLDVTRVPLPWPFDGSGALPRATDGESLAEVLPGVHGTVEDSQAAAREALGARPDALDRVADLVADAARGLGD
jgi:hypothetical protein